MSEYYEYVTDINGKVILDENGNPKIRLAGCIDSERAMYLRRLHMQEKKKEEVSTKSKKASKKHAPAKKKKPSTPQHIEKEPPQFPSKVLFNDSGMPITMANGYSSEDITALYGDEPENE